MSTRTTITVGDEEVAVERVSALKASRAFALLKQISEHVPRLTRSWGEYVLEYERENVTELSRPQARLRFPPRPLLDPDTRAPLREPELMRIAGQDGGDPELVPNPRAGELVMVPSVVDNMTEEDWAAAGNVLRLPESPATGQVIAAVFAEALEVAEESVYRLLALLTIRNEDVFRAWRNGGRSVVDELVEERVEFLLGNAYADELLELAVVAGETVDEQFRSKAAAIGADRLGKALRLVGLTPESLQRMTAEPTSSTSTGSTPSSSTDGPASSDGPGTSPSTPRSTSSSDSPAESETSATASGQRDSA